MPIDWGVNQLRLSVFCNNNTKASDATWKMLTGQDEAETRTSVPGGKNFGGNVAGGVLNLIFAAQRLDLILTAKPPEKPEPAIPTVGQWAEVRNNFDRMSNVLLGSMQQEIVRLAVGGVLLGAKETLDDTYGELSRLLKSLRVQPKIMRDLHYRVNWPTESKAMQGLKINRLTTWAAMRIQMSFMQITGDKMSVAGSADNELFAVRLECDHNTDASNQAPFDPKLVLPIYNELLGLFVENAEKGEILP